MSEAKDPAIKLFGKTIPLLEIAAADQDLYSDTGQNSPACTDDSSAPILNNDGDEVDKDTLETKLAKTTLKERASTLTSEHCTGLDETAGTNPETASMDNETATLKSSKNEEDQNDTGASDDKTLKKPDKIIPCPRCASMDTKFCYYNNYNVNQPRHFCRKCQRYWTAGGTMRNVPVGAGRRKNKNSTSHNITVPEPLQNVLSQKLQNCTTNGLNVPQSLIIPVSYEGIESVGSEMTNVPSMTTLNSKVELCPIGMQGPPMMQNYQTIPPQIPCFPGAPWPYAWPSGYPMPFYPVPTYWGCGVPGAWAVPWMPQPASPNGPASPLGKHSREEEVINPSKIGAEELSKVSKSERCLWIPKTLRIDEPGEAAKSSIWETLGIKNELGDSKGLFKAFKSKGDEKNHVPKSSPALQANPAAMSRSINFHERS